MPVNVSAAICKDTAEKIVVTRFSAGSYVNGIYQKGGTSDFKTLASVQQPTMKQLQRLPEGLRDKDIMLFVSKKSLRGTSDRDNISADMVTHKSIQYEITDEGNWSSYGYTSVFGIRIP